MTVKEAMVITAGPLKFGDPQLIEAVLLLELVKKVGPLSKIVVMCSRCDGYGQCCCEVCEGDSSEDCPTDGICSRCKGSGTAALAQNDIELLSLTASEIHAALGQA